MTRKLARKKPFSPVVHFFCFVVFAGTTCSIAAADVPATLGGGSISHSLSKAKVQLRVLNTVGVGMCRVPVAPNDYGLDSGQPATRVSTNLRRDSPYGSRREG